MTRKWIIDPKTRAIVSKRSAWMCELCHKEPAVHMHHLTYERVGCERPEDLQHICLICHIGKHPEKAFALAQFEFTRAPRAMQEAADRREWRHQLEEEDRLEAERQKEYEKYVQQETDKREAEREYYSVVEEPRQTWPTKQTFMSSVRDILNAKTIQSIPSEMTYAQMASERDRQKSALFAKFGNVAPCPLPESSVE